MAATVEDVTQLERSENASFEKTQGKRPDLKRESYFPSLAGYIAGGAVYGAVWNIIMEGVFSLIDKIPRKDFFKKVPSEATKGALIGSVIFGIVDLATTRTRNWERADTKPYIEALEHENKALKTLLPIVQENAQNKKHIEQLEKERTALLAQIPDGAKR